MTFKFGERSTKELAGVEPRLVRVCERAIARSTVDFACHDGTRTIEEQREYVARGVSKTLASKHLIQADGFGHAVDLVPYINGKLRWEAKPLYEIAAIMHEEAIAEGLELVWGGVWDRQLDELGLLWDRETLSLAGKLELEVQLYTQRRQKLGRKAFIDLPHFETFW